MRNDFRVMFLGVIAGQPIGNACTSSQVLSYRKDTWMIDCGEGTQMKMQQYRISRARIKGILISHLHGDHVYGLLGLLTSLAIANRKEYLIVVGPTGIKEFIEVGLRLSHAFLPFTIQIIECDPESPCIVYEDDRLAIHTIELFHRVPTIGFIFREKPQRHNLRKDMIDLHALTIPQIQAILRNESITTNQGVNLTPDEMTYTAKLERSYAYCSDTGYNIRVSEQIGKVDVLYHESTFLQNEMKAADQWQHSTAYQAAFVARDVNAKSLVLGHFSARYLRREDFREEALQIFKTVILGAEGLEIILE